MSIPETVDNPGYHKFKIEKGVLGQLSKVQEELDEAVDAEYQECKIMIEVELSDLLGALKNYSQKNFKLSLDDLYSLSFDEIENDELGHHLLNIRKGADGELSKIQEYLDKAKESEESGSLSIMPIYLSLILLATKKYADKHLQRSLSDLKIMQEITERAFKSGRRG